MAASVILLTVETLRVDFKQLNLIKCKYSYFLSVKLHPKQTAVVATSQKFEVLKIFLSL